MGEKLSKMSMFIHGEILDPETTSETWLLSFDRVVFAIRLSVKTDRTFRIARHY